MRKRITKRTIKLRDTPQIRSFNKALRKGAKTQHVVRDKNGWAVKRARTKRASRVFPNQRKAINAAKDTARRNKTNVVIHKRDGRIRKVVRYY